MGPQITHCKRDVGLEAHVSQAVRVAGHFLIVGSLRVVEKEKKRSVKKDEIDVYERKN